MSGQAPEMRVGWLCNPWSKAQKMDTAEAWSRVRELLYAALQTIHSLSDAAMPTQTYLRLCDFREAYDTLYMVAQERAIECCYRVEAQRDASEDRGGAA